MSMKIAVLSDIHGNYIAFRKCVEYAISEGVKTFIFLGDYLGEFPYPQRTMEYLYELKEKYVCHLVRGNRDVYLVDYRKDGEVGWTKGNSASGALLYTYERVSEMDLEFFENLPEKQILTFSDMPALTICHGSPERVNGRMIEGEKGVYEIMERDSSSYILCGHTHKQVEICHGGKFAWNPGSVGLSLRTEGKTKFMILHGTKDGWRPEFLSLSYEVDEVIREFRESGLDEYAPYWSAITKSLLRGGEVDPAKVLDRAMELCAQKQGTCNWPEIPEEYWGQAYKELVTPMEE